MRTRNLTERPEGYYADVRARTHAAAVSRLGVAGGAALREQIDRERAALHAKKQGQHHGGVENRRADRVPAESGVRETIEAQTERHRAARSDRAARRYVQPENEYQMAGLRLQAERGGRDFAAEKHPPGTTLASRPPILQRGFAVAIVEASTTLTPNEKRLWRRILDLDQPKGYKLGGCFASDAWLARRLAMNRQGVTRARANLLRYGLLYQSMEGVTAVRCFPTLPPWVTCTRPEPVTKGKATDAWIMAQSAELDAGLSAQVEEARMAKQAKAEARRAKVGQDASSGVVRNSPPEKEDFSHHRGQILPEAGRNYPLKVPRLMPLLPPRLWQRDGYRTGSFEYVHASSSR